MMAQPTLAAREAAQGCRVEAISLLWNHCNQAEACRILGIGRSAMTTVLGKEVPKLTYPHRGR